MHTGRVSASVFVYSNDNVCEQFAHECHFSFNPSNSKSMSFNLLVSRPLRTPIFQNPGKKCLLIIRRFNEDLHR